MMFATKRPFGAINQKLIAWRLPITKDGRFYIMDRCSSVIEIEGAVYYDLQKKGIPVYEGKINTIRVSELQKY